MDFTPAVELQDLSRDIPYPADADYLQVHAHYAWLVENRPELLPAVFGPIESSRIIRAFRREQVVTTRLGMNEKSQRLEEVELELDGLPRVDATDPDYPKLQEIALERENLLHQLMADSLVLARWQIGLSKALLAEGDRAARLLVQMGNVYRADMLASYSSEQDQGGELKRDIKKMWEGQMRGAVGVVALHDHLVGLGFAVRFPSAWLDVVHKADLVLLRADGSPVFLQIKTSSKGETILEDTHEVEHNLLESLKLRLVDPIIPWGQLEPEQVVSTRHTIAGQIREQESPGDPFLTLLRALFEIDSLRALAFVLGCSMREGQVSENLEALRSQWETFRAGASTDARTIFRSIRSTAQSALDLYTKKTTHRQKMESRARWYGAEAIIITVGPENYSLKTAGAQGTLPAELVKSLRTVAGPVAPDDSQ